MPSGKFASKEWRGKKVPAIDGLPIDRGVAMLLGTRHYNTGVPCRNGHRAPTRTKDDRCTECSSVRRAELLEKRHRELREMNEYKRGNG